MSKLDLPKCILHRRNKGFAEIVVLRSKLKVYLNIDISQLQGPSKEPSIYTITVTAFDDRNSLLNTHSLQTSIFFLENFFRGDPSQDIDVKTNVILKMDEIPNRTVKSEDTLPVSGTISYLNGTGINNEKMVIKLNSTNDESTPPFTSDPTDDNGNFKIEIPTSYMSDNQKYTVYARPQNDEYSSLLVNRYVDVLAPSPSVGQMITIVGGIVAIGGAILGAVFKVPSYYKEKNHRRMFCTYTKNILNECDKNRFKETRS